MDMLNKLKDNFTSYASSAVTNTVYSTGNIISGVLPGNPVTRYSDQISCESLEMKMFRDFEVTAHIASAGPGLLWKVIFPTGFSELFPGVQCSEEINQTGCISLCSGTSSSGQVQQIKLPLTSCCQV